MRVITLRKRNICWCAASVSLLAAVSTVIYAHHAYQSMKCSDSESKYILEEMCNEAKSKRITGNMCDALCENKQYSYIKCLSTREGKQVYLMESHSRNRDRFILKSKHAYLHDYDSIGFRDATSGKIIHPSNQNFYEMIWDSVWFNLHVKLTETGMDVVKRFWNGESDEFDVRSGMRPAAFDSLWSLMQQDEYTLSQFTKHHGNVHIPKIYGSCGHFYMIEYVQPGRLLDPGFFEITQIKNLKWMDQVDVAIGLLNLVKSFDTDFHEQLHMCDVKGENFGMALDMYNVKAIDTDMAMFDTKLKVQFLNTNCSAHADCDFFDCKGWCDLSTGKCTTFRINNNLQAVCEKIFVGGVHNAYHGLLQNPPEKARDRLESLLEICSRPSRDPTLTLPGCSRHACPQEPGTRWAARRETLQSLHSTLKLSLLK